eukprot:scaffold31714_cov78-Skeletonema_dohrnii-CCMP3373.AAC.1
MKSLVLILALALVAFAFVATKINHNTSMSSTRNIRYLLADDGDWDEDDDVQQPEDISNNDDDDLVQYFETSFRVVNDAAPELQIEIINPKPRYQYSVTVESIGKYTGTATLLSQKKGMLVYSWRPSFAATYEVYVHELERNRYGAHVKTPLIKPSPLSVTISPDKTNTTSEGIESLEERARNMIPCQSVTHMNVFSRFDGDWIGPNVNIEADTLRTGWTFVPSKAMNCTFETFSQQDLLSIPEKKSIHVIGTSKERGVFLALADLLLTDDEKFHIHKSVIGQCWGRVNITKGNLEL